MLSFSFHAIAHQIDAVLEREQPSLMGYRLSQTTVPIMAGDQKVESLALNPFLHPRFSQANPGKWGSRLGLAGAVRAEGVVHSSPAEVVTFAAFADVFVGPGIDQQRVAAAIQADAKRIGVPVSAPLRALRTGVHD